MADVPGGDWLTSAIGAGAAILGSIGSYFVGRRKSNAEARKVDAEADATIDSILNKKIETLIDGYEKRIADLTQEVHSLRDEVKSLRQALDKRPAAGGSIIGI